MAYIKGLGWVEDTPTRPINMVCRDCGRAWTTHLLATEEEIAKAFPVEPVPSYCSEHETQVDE